MVFPATQMRPKTHYVRVVCDVSTCMYDVGHLIDCDYHTSDAYLPNGKICKGSNKFEVYNLLVTWVEEQVGSL